MKLLLNTNQAWNFVLMGLCACWAKEKHTFLIQLRKWVSRFKLWPREHLPLTKHWVRRECLLTAAWASSLRAWQVYREMMVENKLKDNLSYLHDVVLTMWCGSQSSSWQKCKCWYLTIDWGWWCGDNSEAKINREQKDNKWWRNE